MAIISIAREREAYITRPEIKKYNVWVDGEKMTPKFINYTEAKELYNKYKQDGFYDVVITGARS